MKRKIKIPDGWRLLLVGDVVKAGDRFSYLGTTPWVDTAYVDGGHYEIMDKNPLVYIRRVEAYEK